jgi:hypothetical protein
LRASRRSVLIRSPGTSGGDEGAGDPQVGQPAVEDVAGGAGLVAGSDCAGIIPPAEQTPHGPGGVGDAILVDAAIGSQERHVDGFSSYVEADVGKPKLGHGGRPPHVTLRASRADHRTNI